VSTGSKSSEVIAVADDPSDLVHDACADAASLPVRRCRDSLHVAGPQRPVADVDGSLDDRRMPDDDALLLGDDVDAAQRVVPIGLGEPAVLVVGEGGPKELAVPASS